ncbi:hypothetical protein [Hyalangium rubrum]|uniref:Uncharacterized protein n=1 Tax=Hyalangium rubrum TaxID=3103134 RepID=A0ABU5HDR1_9BACT|nr:hypothetical protein [Hyalangium sp. s54d21]MDY7231608.1 hypothetical protein [Hyalangium sp. s54d21]
MEWLEFKPWTREVEQRLANQAARLHTLSQPVAKPQVTLAQAYHLQSLLRRCPRTNPWGHPSAEC